MSRFRRTALSLVAVLVAVLVAATLASPRAAAFVTLLYGNDPPTWDTSDVRYYISTAGTGDVSSSELEAALAGAFQAWEDVSCATIGFTYGGRRSSAPDGGVFVRFQESGWDPTVGDAAAYAMSYKDWYGNITSAEIVYNAVDITWTTNAAVASTGVRSDIQGVAAHEIGHTIGLDHTRHLEATMFYSSSGGPEMRTLDADDERGACFLYPSGTFSGGQVCDQCEDNGDCAGGTCIEYSYDSAPNTFCGQACVNDAGCPDGYFCYTDNDLDQCVPDNGYCDDAGRNVLFGGFCYGYDVCESGLTCLPFAGDAYCTQECSSWCPEDYQCISGYCLRGGGGQLGDPCTTPYDCESIHCVTAAPSNYICSLECATDADCPGSAGCTWESCFPRGSAAFGAPCDVHMDCASAHCGGYGEWAYCTESCTFGDDGPCPTGSHCTSSGYCSPVDATTGDVCESGSDCPSGNFCWFTSASATEGTCVRECNPYTGYSCDPDDACGYVEMPWLGLVKGACRPRNGGPGAGAGCHPTANPCEWDKVCGRVGAGDFRCYPHCRTDSGLGCVGGEGCRSLGESSAPLHGFCYEDVPPPPPDTGGVDVPRPPPPDVVSPPRDVPQPPRDVPRPPPDLPRPPSPDTGSTIRPDSGAAAAPDAGGSGFVDGTSPPLSIDGGAGIDLGPAAPGLPAGSGGCAVFGGPAGAGAALLLALLAGALFVSARALRALRKGPRRRRRSGWPLRCGAGRSAARLRAAG